MIVQKAPNGWPGIFIPGDEALSLARDMARIADNIGKLNPEHIATFLRAKAQSLSACKVKTNGS